MESIDLADLLDQTNPKQIKSIGKIAAKELDIEWNLNLHLLILCLKNHPKLIPGKIMGADLKSALIVWLRKYKNGLNSRSSGKAAKPPSVKRDPILKHVLQVSNPNLSLESIENIFENHTLAMSIENNIGGLLEDYIALNLEPKGWISAWGSTLRAVDFYEPRKNKFLQIKNRSNSENSSSMSVRKGTDIEKWFRINALNGKTHWEKLEAITGVKGMSEKGFFAFVEKAMAQNPKLFYLGTLTPSLK